MSPRETAAALARGRQAPAPAPPADEAPAAPAEEAPVPPAEEAPAPPAREAPAPTSAHESAAPEDNQELRTLGRETLARAEQSASGPPGATAPVQPQAHASRPDERSEQDGERSFDIARVAWLVTVLALLVAVAILVQQGYLGYAGVTLAVAVAAAINLL
jgi:hypothetical protein